MGVFFSYSYLFFSLSLRKRTSYNETDQKTCQHWSFLSCVCRKKKSSHKKTSCTNFSFFSDFCPPTLVSFRMPSGLFLPLRVVSQGFPCHHHVSCHRCAGTFAATEKVLTQFVQPVSFTNVVTDLCPLIIHGMAWTPLFFFFFVTFLHIL